MKLKPGDKVVYFKYAGDKMMARRPTPCPSRPHAPARPCVSLRGQRHRKSRLGASARRATGTAVAYRTRSFRSHFCAPTYPPECLTARHSSSPIPSQDPTTSIEYVVLHQSDVLGKL